MRILLLVLLLTVTAYGQDTSGDRCDESFAGVFGDAVAPNVYHARSGRFCFAWHLNASASGRMDMAMRGDTRGWVGMGIADDLAMVNTDMIVASVDDNTGAVHLRDVNTFGMQSRQQPFDDGDSRQNVVLVDGAQSDDGWTRLRFWRLVDTDDSVGDMPLTRSTVLLWALGQDDDDLMLANDGTGAVLFNEHPSTGTRVLIDWFPDDGDGDGDDGDVTDELGGTGDAEQDAVRTHAGLMIFAFLFCAVFGAATSRYFKAALGAAWLGAHIVLQLGTLALSFGALGVIVVRIDELDRPHVDSAHAVVGIVVLAVVGLQALVGVALSMVHRGKDAEQLDRVGIFELGHAVSGCVLLALAIAAIFLGLAQNNDIATTADTHDAVPWACLGAWLGCLLVAIVALEIVTFNKRGRQPDSPPSIALLLAILALTVAIGIALLAVSIVFLYE
jgi:DOMON domain/Eukaryotic cytochrome b561